MKPIEKQISYTTTNTYLSLNTLDKNTKNVWIVFHGIGFLSKYFLNYFSQLPRDINYIIAPQAPSKYYLNNEYKRVGASWLTKENRALETKNILSYLDNLYQSENIPSHCKLIILGFSQGVSIASRWVAHSKIPCHQLCLYAGGIPAELKPEDFHFLKEHSTQIKIIYGDQDPLLSGQRLQQEKTKIDTLFQGKAQFISFEGGHVINKDLINNLAE
ncbi:Predicted esterase [Arenibacter nanhaiticus]|uniref:Predicted esterase n=1 Tax=Arenibacter nanhaiticus TaxID=558155 RepID=A0A1M6G4N1_9FLAO|nr:esterase [Arenibacter nanhaiticus]SHJ04842.1 Predicted esterase [Arenibacter nanhaiticus]